MYPFTDIAIPNNKYLNEMLLIELDKRLQKDKVDSCLIVQDGSIVYQYYRNRKMKVKQHKIHSVTKSVLSALIGIAIDKGYIENVHVPIEHYFPELKEPSVDKRKKEISIFHLLTMTAGLRWTSNSEMESSKNWVRYILDRPMEQQPGSAMNYCCGYSHLLSAIISRTSGMDASTFAKKYLFGPLDIKDYRWPSDAQGISNGGFGLVMKTVDMMKIGYLYLNNGRWFSKQILTESWIKESTTPRLDSYGYHWWVLTDLPRKIDAPTVYYAQGYGGNNIIVVPDYQLITVFTGSIFEDSSRPFRLFKELILPALMD